MEVLERRLGCYIETGDVPPQPSARKHAPWPQFCEPRPVQIAASHLVRAEATVSCRGRGGSAVAQAPNLYDLSLIMGTILPSRALWRVSAGWDMVRDG
jgi:hypothetical protein